MFGNVRIYLQEEEIKLGQTRQIFPIGDGGVEKEALAEKRHFQPQGLKIDQT